MLPGSGGLGVDALRLEMDLTRKKLKIDNLKGRSRLRGRGVDGKTVVNWQWYDPRRHAGKLWGRRILESGEIGIRVLHASRL